MSMYKKLIMALVILSSFMNSAIMSRDLQDLIDEAVDRLGFIYYTENQLGKKTSRDFSTEAEAQELISNLLACANSKINKKDHNNCYNGLIKIKELRKGSFYYRDGEIVRTWLEGLQNDALAGNLLKK